VLATANLQRSQWLLGTLADRGLLHVVVCPGSRSGPLVSAAHHLEQAGRLRLHPGIDERSAAFFALGLARGRGAAAAVITTSGTAVANLLPAVVEAHHSGLPLLLLSADRPGRLKGCGANQTVDQQRFLEPCCRLVIEGPDKGLATAGRPELMEMVEQLWSHAHGVPPGPVHCNLPFEEPLYPTLSSYGVLESDEASVTPGELPGDGGAHPAHQPSGPLDPLKPCVIVAGPWRGRLTDHARWLHVLRQVSERLGWPVLADPLSGVRGADGVAAVLAYDVILASPRTVEVPGQVLRLGPMPTSRRLQSWLQSVPCPQTLVLECDPRPQDPLRLAHQRADGLVGWWEELSRTLPEEPSVMESRRLCDRWLAAEHSAQSDLERALPLEGLISEPALARWLPRLLPAHWPVLLANSSPVRDWESFGPSDAPHRWVDGFRGASGIDGTLSLAMGLSVELERLVLVCGDLALLHDSNGWLWSHQICAQLTVVLIDNAGGGIFEQLPIRLDAGAPSEDRFERLFAMPQAVQPRQLAAAHSVPSRVVPCLEDLPAALEWSLCQPVALLHLHTNRRADAALRQLLRAPDEVRMETASTVVPEA